jgi:predicted nucleic acid-binding protein
MTTAELLCDTNVLGELARKTPNEGVLSWARGVSFLAISAITIEEVLFGLAAKSNSRVRSWFEAFVASSCEILPVTQEIARRSGELRGQLRSRGQTHSQADMLIAATAHVHQMTLVTRNRRDFEGCGLSLLDPFT